MFVQNQILNDCYQILRPLGNGGTSSVYLAYHLRLQKHVVIKQLRGGITDPGLLRTEADILKNLHHQSLPQVYDYIQDQDHVYTIIDFVDGYDLDAYIRSSTKFPEPLLKRYLRQIASVLDYLHSQPTPVVHSDIKPGNIIIDQQGNAILIDFNTSIGANQGNLLGLTLPYASPEQIRLAQYAACFQTADFTLDGRSDIYSLGATFYELISGIQPTPGVRPAPLHTMGISQYSRDLLLLIDRMMEPDREKRPKSAKKLAAAIERMDGSYWKYFALRSVSLLLSAALIGGGAYCLIRGQRRGSMEAFQTSHSAAVAFVAQGSLDQAETACNAIFADEQMQAYLQEETGELARLYHVVGDISYYREEYATAATNYYQALSYCLQSGGEDWMVFLRDAAMAYTQSGQLDMARSLLDSAQSMGASSQELQMIGIAIDARSGDLQQSADQARELITQCTDRQLCLRTAMCIASAAEDLDSRIWWLQVAHSYDTGRTVLRQLAAAYGQKASLLSGQEQKTALDEASSIYAQLCDSVYASSVDRLNYSVILRMQQKHSDALDVLKAAQQHDGSNYRIAMNMCFTYYEMGMESYAMQYCRETLEAWRADPSSDKLSEASEDIQNLLEIAHRFGIGGI